MRNTILPLIFGALLVYSSGFAQKCGTYPGSLEEQIQKYPLFYEGIEYKNIELEKQHEKALSKLVNLKTDNGIKIIPVVVHVIHDMGNENISDESIQGALDILNANINGQAANFLSKTPDVFAAVRGDAKLEFRLAKLDPLGNPTTGINRVRSSLTEEPQPRDAVKSLSYWNSYQYFNIWTVKKFAPQDDGNTLLGYAQFPNTGKMSTDGVVLLASQMVSGGTLTHECGHWLGLRHTWGDATCGDDGVKDTPPARDPNFGVNISDFPYHVGLQNQGCIGDSLNWAGEMFVNYMDYSSDPDVTMFTKDQNAIMNITLDGSYDEQTGTSSIGFREYMWQAANLDSTGTADGYISPSCTQKPTFVVMNGLPSICEGESILFKGNQPMFGSGNVSSFVWDFGDGTIDDSGDNFISHTYSSGGSFDVSLTVEYDENIEVRVVDPNSLPGGPFVYDTLSENYMVQGTMIELMSMGASNITEIQLDSLGLYFGMADSSYFRGYVKKYFYTATYTNTCTSTYIREGFVNVSNTSASSTGSSYSYSFDDASELNGDWMLNQSTNIESQWSFNPEDNTSWKWESSIAPDGISFSSIKVASDDMLVGVSTEIVSKAYDLSTFSNPAIKFSFSGAAVNTFPVNELAVKYSNDCGESWRELGVIGAVEASNAGLYTNSFTPNSFEWNDTVMSDAQLKDSNIKFKFEYIVNGVSNNFYLDDIMIGEEASLMVNQANFQSRISVFPNPVKGNTMIILDNIADKQVEVTLINILGSEVKKLFSGVVVSKYQEISTDLTGLEKGIYFVNVVSNGDIVITEKLIVK